MRSVRRVLVLQPYGIGDLLFTTPVLRALRVLPSVEKVDLLLGSRTDSVVRQNPHVDEIFTVDKDLFHRQSRFQTIRDSIELGKMLRAQKYDLLLDYSLRSEYGFFGGLFLGIPRRAGFNYKRRGFFHNIRVDLPFGFQDKHVTEYFCDLAEKAGVPVKDRFLEFYLKDQERQEADQLVAKKFGAMDKRFLVLSPGGGESWGKEAHLKRWPIYFFLELVRMLTGELSLEGVLLVGNLREKKLAEDFIKNLDVPCIDLMGELSLAQSAALIEKSSLFVGNDGGLVHIARALGVPLVAFYGPVDSKVYGPYPPSRDAVAVFKESLECRPCYRKFRYNSACIKHECLRDLQPNDVFNFLKTQGIFERVKVSL